MAKGMKINLKGLFKGNGAEEFDKAVKAMQDTLQKGKKLLLPDIQVMMLGARRVGKTSVLASMVNQFNRVTAETNLVLTKEMGKEIDSAFNSMKGYFAGEPAAYAPVSNMDTESTSGFNYFDLNLSIAGKKSRRPRKIRFKDCAGEWITNYSNQNEIASEVEKSDVIIIAIDSVLLMEENGKYNHQNSVENVTNFIKDNMRPEENANNHKMVLFVPLKCEKYYWQNQDKGGLYYNRRMNDLNKAIKDAYEDLFVFFAKPNNRKYFDVAILPILTIGGIEFYEFLADKDKKTILSGDIRYVYCKNPVFEPKFCEQPLIYSLLFEYNKIQKGYMSEAYDKNNHKKISAMLGEWILDKRNLAKDQDYIIEMKKLEGCIKESGDGFEIIQRASIQ